MEGGGKMHKKMIARRYWTLHFVSLILLAALISRSYAGELGKLKYGFSVLGGAGDAWYEKPDMTVYGFGVQARIPVLSSF